jgi:hypothetical protein
MHYHLPTDEERTNPLRRQSQRRGKNLQLYPPGHWEGQKSCSPSALSDILPALQARPQSLPSFHAFIESLREASGSPSLTVGHPVDRVCFSNDGTSAGTPDLILNDDLKL